MVYSVVFEGVVECSNTMEDEEDTELIPQALVYKTCRQRIYSVLLPSGKGTCRLPLSLSVCLHVELPYFPLSDTKYRFILGLWIHGQDPCIHYEIWWWEYRFPNGMSKFLSCVFRNRYTGASCQRVVCLCWKPAEGTWISPPSSSQHLRYFVLFHYI